MLFFVTLQTFADNDVHMQHIFLALMVRNIRAHTHSNLRLIFSCTMWSAHGFKSETHTGSVINVSELFDCGGSLTFYVNDMPSGAVYCKCCQSIVLTASVMASVQ